MLKSVMVACACALAIPAQARADVVGRIKTIEAAPPEALPQQVTEVEQRRSPAGAIVGDTIGGAVLGAAVGGGVAAYHRYVENDGWGDWQKSVLIGAGIGAGVGLIIGIATAASSDRTFTGPIADQRQTGFSPPTAVYGAKF